MTKVFNNLQVIVREKNRTRNKFPTIRAKWLFKKFLAVVKETETE